jgi:hypothetical protein
VLFHLIQNRPGPDLIAEDAQARVAKEFDERAALRFSEGVTSTNQESK